ncbi:hypothetical protein GW17_00059072, partial [Ensete ventricosum]
ARPQAEWRGGGVGVTLVLGDVAMVMGVETTVVEQGSTCYKRSRALLQEEQKKWVEEINGVAGLRFLVDKIEVRREEGPKGGNVEMRRGGVVMLRLTVVRLLLWPLLLVPRTTAVWLNLPASGTKCVSEEIQPNVVVIADYVVASDGTDIALQTI